MPWQFVFFMMGLRSKRLLFFFFVSLVQVDLFCVQCEVLSGCVALSLTLAIARHFSDLVAYNRRVRLQVLPSEVFRLIPLAGLGDQGCATGSHFLLCHRVLDMS